MKIYLPIVFAILGFLFSARPWILFLDGLSPLNGLLIYYFILTITIILLEYFGLIIAGIKFDSLRHTIGSMLIIFAFFIVVTWTSCYINMVTKGQCSQISNIYLQSEDGTVYYLWSFLFKDIDTLRLLTYVITPFVLSFIGQLLITRKVSISPF